MRHWSLILILIWPDRFSFQQFRAISRRVTEVLDRRSGIQLAQLAERPHLYFARELAA
jgi:hypothetical protein